MQFSLLLRFSLLVVIIFFTLKVSSQTVIWAKKGISPGFDYGNAIVADDSGNVYVTGQIEFTSVFDNVSLTSYGQHDIVVAKYDAAGILKWIRKAGGLEGDIGLGIGIDSSHNVYVTGEIEGVARFSSSITLTSSGNNDGFIAKYDVNGIVLWAKRFGNSSRSDKGRAIAVSPAGNCYITGNFSSTVIFGSTTLTSNGGNDIFVVKYDSNGNVGWAKRAGGSKQDRGHGIAIDPAENVYVTGAFTSSARFKTTTITNSGKYSTFLAKYNSGGTFQWAKAAGSCCDSTQASGVTLDEDGNIYIAGLFADKAKFSSITLQSYGLKDIFIAKYSPTGSVLWAKHAGGSKEDIAYGITYDKIFHSIYLTGFVESSGTSGGIPYSFSGYKDVIIAAYDFSGNTKWVKTYGGSRRDIGNAITVDPLGFIYTTGIFNGTAPFGSIILTGYPNQPWADFFVNKILSPGFSSGSLQSTINNLDHNLNQHTTSGLRENSGIAQSSLLLNQIKIFPNPFKNYFSLSSQNPISYNIYNVLGNLLAHKENVQGEISVGENLLPGIYYLQVIDGNEKKIYSVIKVE